MQFENAIKCAAEKVYFPFRQTKIIFIKTADWQKDAVSTLKTALPNHFPMGSDLESENIQKLSA